MLWPRVRSRTLIRISAIAGSGRHRRQLRPILHHQRAHVGHFMRHTLRWITTLELCNGPSVRVLEGHAQPRAESFDFAVLDYKVLVYNFGDAQIAQRLARALDRGLSLIHI